MDLEALYEKIIPPDNYESRKDFSNEDLINELDYVQLGLIENKLINNLVLKSDLLIIETLAYIESKKSIPIIKDKLKEATNPEDKIIIAWAIYSLEGNNNKMIDVAYDNFLSIDNDYAKTYLFYYLAKFNSIKLDSLLKHYSNSENFLLSYNAKRFLEDDS